MLTLKNLKRIRGKYLFPGHTQLYKKEDAIDILTINNFVDEKYPTLQVKASVISKIIREIQNIKREINS